MSSKHYFSRIKLSNQILILLISIFLVFIILQLIATLFLFSNTFITNQAPRYDDSIAKIRTEINENTGEEFQKLYNESQETGNTYLILTSTGNLKESGSQVYDFELNGVTYLLPYPVSKLDIGQQISITKNSSNKLSQITYKNETFHFFDCNTDCITDSGVITNSNVPENLNYYYKNRQEINLILYNHNEAETTHTDNGNKWFIFEIEEAAEKKYIIYESELKNGDILLTIIEVESSTGVFNIIMTYNAFIYLIVFVISVLLAKVLSGVLSKPIEELNTITSNISNLNFGTSTNVYGNRETKELSLNINKMSKNLENTIQDLKAKNEKVSLLLEQIQNQFKLKKDLMSSISHEIKTPLAVILSVSQGIIDGIFTEEEAKNELKLIQEEVTSTTKMLEDLINLYKLDDSSTKLDFEEIQISEFFNQIIKQSNALIHNYEMKLINMIEDSSSTVNIDKVLLKRVVQNLLLNACKYSPPKNKILVASFEHFGIYRFEITNTGTMISNDEMEFIFEPFYRVDKSGSKTQRSSGNGLGLFIVKQVLEKHQFDFGIYSTDSSTTFFIEMVIANKKTN